MQSDLREAQALNREVLSLAEKYGQRTWVIQAIGGGLDVAMHLGSWQDFAAEADTEVADAPIYYRTWVLVQAAWRDVFRGDPERSLAVADEAIGSELSSVSRQALTWYQAIRADALSGLGRFEEAWSTAEAGWGRSGETDNAFAAGLFAGAGAGDVGKIEATRAAWRHQQTGEHLPQLRGFEHTADAFAAALEGRWEEARTAYLAAGRTFGELGDALAQARLQLAIGHLAEGMFGEAAAALEEASAFFAERGASAYVERYRAAAKQLEAGTGRERASRAGVDKGAPVRATR
jgi:hypothetical protein